MPSINLVDEFLPRFILEGEPSCAATDPELFFAQENELEGSARRAKYVNERAAKAICYECPLMGQCLEFALRNNDSGIWGGTTENERANIRRRTGIKLAPVRHRNW